MGSHVRPGEGGIARYFAGAFSGDALFARDGGVTGPVPRRVQATALSFLLTWLVNVRARVPDAVATTFQSTTLRFFALAIRSPLWALPLLLRAMLASVVAIASIR